MKQGKGVNPWPRRVGVVSYSGPRKWIDLSHRGITAEYLLKSSGLFKPVL